MSEGEEARGRERADRGCLGLGVPSGSDSHDGHRDLSRGNGKAPTVPAVTAAQISTLSMHHSILRCPLLLDGLYNI